jgi:hypothetical protein
MLTIGQLAAYAGVTVRAVRRYHQTGLLPEPERDASARWVAAVGQLLPTHAYADTSWQIAGDSLALRIIDQGHPGQILHVMPHHRTLDLPRCAARAIVARSARNTFWYSRWRRRTRS